MREKGGGSRRFRELLQVRSTIGVRLSWCVLAEAGSGLFGSSRNSCRRTAAPGKSEGRVQRDGPHWVRSHRTENERHVHDVEKRKEEKGLGEKTAVDDELGPPGEVHVDPVVFSLAINKSFEVSR
jgi:hypothetical protein